MWFVESRAQAKWMRARPREISNERVVALTAEALQALEEFGVKHTAVAEYANTRPVAAVARQLHASGQELLRDIETYVLGQYSDTRVSDHGFLTSHIYWVCHLITILAARAHLLQETIRACSPSTVLMFKFETDERYMLRTSQPLPWFPSLPMSSLLDQLASRYSFQLDVRSSNIVLRRWFDENLLRVALYRARRIPVRLRRIAARQGARFASINPFSRENSGKDDRCLLMVGGLNHEWETITSTLEQSHVHYLGWADNRAFTGEHRCHGWSAVYDTKLTPVSHHAPIDLAFDTYRPDEEERNVLTDLYDRWETQGKLISAVNFNGLDLLSDLIAVLRPLTIYGLSLCRHVDRAVSSALDAASPDAVCFQGVVNMADKRMARACHMRGIPTVGIQHGGSVGTHVNNLIDANDWGSCDYYLTYGDGIKATPDPVVPRLASLVPVGSPSVDQRITAHSSQKQGYRGSIRVLWISDKAFGNTIGHASRPEDTKRYLLQKQCLITLGRSTGLQVTFRPSKSTEEMLGTVRWLKRDAPINAQVDVVTTLDELLCQSDVVITDNSASTVWNEAIAFQKPLILFCDPKQTLLMPDFTADLEKACLWCKTEYELIAAVRRLSTTGLEFLSDLRQIDTSSYLEKYVLYRNDGQSKQRAVTFLTEICSDGQSSDKLSVSSQDVV